MGEMGGMGGRGNRPLCNLLLLMYSYFEIEQFFKKISQGGHLGGSVGYTSDFSSGHDLAACDSSPASGSVLTTQNLEPALDSVTPSLSAPPPLIPSPSLSLSKVNKH